MTGDRYQVVLGSQSGHCCFDATVIDTHTQDVMKNLKKPVCECFEVKDAEKIAEALNKICAEPE